ncbi:GTP-binding protein EngB [hydrothermal vent metagenome]|uniref:GTP-binding protein EngB n=1 Tax=hydrothermal vent metagenome TaxID=652676 RepID=A0A3B0ZRF1_9ZZZZ
MSGQANNKNFYDKRNLLAKARFLLSSPDMAHVPADDAFEVVFAGRSNAGKSSALNALCGQKSLARTSKTPGRTQQLVFFEIDETHRLVDLPGYGYAKVPVAMQRHWQQTLDKFLTTRKSLKGMVLMMDCRRPLREFDEQMLEWCAHQGMPVLVLLTKADKLKNGPAKSTLLQVKKSLSELPDITVQLFSTLKNTGITEARRHIIKWLELNPASS